MHISKRFLVKSMHVAIEMDISKAVQTDIGMVGRLLYCHILAMAHSMKAGPGISSLLKCAKNWKRF